MLHDLPFEVLSLIVSKLNNSEISNISKALTRLAPTIIQHYQYETVDLTGINKQRKNMLKNLESNEKRLVVKRILVDSSIISRLLMKKLPKMFKNIQEIENHSKRDDFSVNILIQWRASLQRYSSNNRQKIILDSLAVEKFSRLTSISISFDDISKKDLNIRNTNHLDIKNLENAPCLTTIIIYKSLVSMDMIEAVHNSSKLLKNLILSGIHINTNDYTPPNDNDTVASTIKSFFIDSASFLEDPNHVFGKYIVSKYTELVHLKLLCRLSFDEDTFPGNILLDPENVILPNLAITVKTLNIASNIAKDIIVSLENSNLSQLQISYDGYTSANNDSLPHSVLSKCLIFDYTLFIDTSNINESCTTGIRIVVKNPMTLQSSFFKNVLLCLPSLKHLSIDENYSFCGNTYFFDSIDTYPSLKSLTITTWVANSLPTEQWHSIFPNLKVLKWISPNTCDPSELYHLLENINLKKLDLDLFQFQLKFDYKKKNDVKFVTNINHTNENKTLTFILHIDSNISNITTVNTPPRSRHIINIVCDNISSIKVNDNYKLY